MNCVIVSGELRKVSEIKTNKGGAQFCTFEIAVPRRKDDGADFIRCAAWLKTAQKLQELAIGSKINIQGYWRTAAVPSMNGGNQRIDELVAENLEVML